MGRYQDVGNFCGSMMTGYGQSMRRGGGVFYTTITLILLGCFLLYAVMKDDQVGKGKFSDLADKSSVLRKDSFSAHYTPLKKESAERLIRNFPEVEYCKVERCVDGDTIIIMSDNIRERIRFIGIDAPELSKRLPRDPLHNNQNEMTSEPYAVEALEYVQSRISSVGNRIYLKVDGDRTDRYDRRLALVYLDEAGNDLLNEELIRYGLARAELQYNYSKIMKERFRQAQKKAQEEKRGIWSALADPESTDSTPTSSKNSASSNGSGSKDSTSKNITTSNNTRTRVPATNARAKASTDKTDKVEQPTESAK